MSETTKIDWSGGTFNTYDPDSVTDLEKMEFGAREETTLTGNIFRYGEAAFDSLTDSKLTFGQALANIESDRQRDLYKEMPKFFGITPDQEDASVLAGRIGTAVADPITWAIPWAKVALAGKTVSAATGAGVAGVDAAARDYLTTGKVDLFNTAVSATIGGGAGTLSAAIARRTRFKEDYSPERVEMDLQPSKPLSAIEVEDVKEAASKAVKPERVSKLTKDKPVLSLNTQPIIDLKKSIKYLKAKKNKAPKNLKKEVQKEIEANKIKLAAARKTYYNNQVETYLAKEDINITMLEDLSSQGKLTDGIMSKILYEGTRPVVGGLGGYALSGIVGDEDSDALTTGLIISGAMLGRYSRAINDSVLSSIEKNTGVLKIKDSAKNSLRITGQYLSAGSLSTRMNSIGGYAKVVGNMLFQRQGAATDSVEARAVRESRKFNTTVNSILGDSFEDETVRKLAGQLINGFDVDSIQVGYRGMDGSLKPITAAQIQEARRVAPLLDNHKNILANSVDEVGISFKREDQYGMAQVYDHAAIRANLDDFYATAREAIRMEHPKLNDEALEIKFQKFVDGVTGAAKYKSNVQLTRENIFSDGKFRPLAEHFEKHRLISDFNARQLLAEKGYINLDVSDVFSIYSDRTIKAREFAKSFGGRGEFLEEVFLNIDKSFVGKPELTKVGNQYKKEILNAIDAYWGTYQVSDMPASQAFVGTFTTLANTSFLTRVSIASLGDMIQPFQNSGFGAAFKSIAQKASRNQPSFSKQVDFQYDKSFERELTALMAGAGDNLSSYQSALHWINTKFFKVVGLETVTKAARGFAYDTGINRAYSLASKSKLSKANLTEAKTMGLRSSDIEVLKKYKGVRQAFDTDEGREILDRVGQKVADRDAILPMVGNRLLFTQSGNPYVRSMGQFLSWAQAKSSQINSLVGRVEDGDTALALRAAGLTSIYAGVQYLREIFKPNYDPYDEDSSHLDDYRGAIQLSKKGMALSGNYVPWQIDKAVRTIDSVFMKGGRLDTMTPSLSYADDFVRSFVKFTGNVAYGDYEGAASNVLSVTPLAKDISGIMERADLVYSPEDRPNKAKGGVITDVPNVPTEPDQRIDKMTGLPYDQQAGTAFVDEEDPLRRLGFKGGGEVDPLARLGFGLGSLVARQASRVIRNVDEAPAKTDKQLEADFDDLTKALDKGETPKMFEEPMGEVAAPKKSEDYLAALNISKDEVDVWKTQNKADDTALSNDPQKQMLARELADQSKPIEQRRSNFLNYLEGKDAEGNVVGSPVVKEWEVDSVEDLIKNMPSDRDVAMSVASKQDKNKFIIGVNDDLKTGDLLAFRLDIPAYRRHNIWTLTAHKPVKGLTWDSNKKGASEVLGYGKTGRLTNVVFSGGDPETNFKIASGAGAKTPLATMQGNWVNHDSFELAEEALRLVKDPKSGWVQIGYNPTNFANFYNRKTLEPITEAEDVIQIGGFLIAKNPKTVDFSPVFTTTKPMKFKDGKTIEAGTQIPFSTGGRVLKALTRKKYSFGNEVRADMRRADGSVKSPRGFLGPVENTVQGGTMTEVSIGTEINGKKMEIPTMVPTLTKDEVKALSSMKLEGNAKNIPESIIMKAKEHARMRLDQGKNPFYQDGE